MTRPVEPHAGQRHGSQHQRVAGHDVLTDHREQQHEPAAEVEAGRQQCDTCAACHEMDEGAHDDRAEAGEEGIEIGELPPRHAALDSHLVQQAAERAMQWEKEVIRWIKRRATGIGDPGLGLDALVHAVDDVGVLQPGDQAAEHHRGKRERGHEMPGWRAFVIVRNCYIRPKRVTAPSGPGRKAGCRAAGPDRPPAR